MIAAVIIVSIVPVILIVARMIHPTTIKNMRHAARANPVKVVNGKVIGSITRRKRRRKARKGENYMRNIPRHVLTKATIATTKTTARNIAPPIRVITTLEMMKISNINIDPTRTNKRI